MQTIKWGIIGPGAIAEEFVRDLSFAKRNHQVIAVLSRTMESANKFISKFSIPKGYTRIDELITESRPDIVYIATPHPYHFESALFCLQNKIPVLCEKPLCINEEQCRKLIEASRGNNVFLMEAMWIRFLPSIQNLLNFIGNGTIGEVLIIQAAMHYKAPYDPDSRYFDRSLGGGSLLDLGIYPVFLSILLLGKPEIIKAVTTLTDDKVDSISSVVFKYANGSQAILESSLVINNDEPAIIHGSKGTIKILHPWFEKSPGLEIHEDGKGVRIYPVRWEGHGLQFEVEEAVKCLEDKKIESQLMPHSLSLEIIKALDEVRRQNSIKYEAFEQ